MKKIISAATLFSLIALVGISLSAAPNNDVSFTTIGGLMESFTADTTGKTVGTIMVAGKDKRNPSKDSLIILSDTKIADKKGTPITAAQIKKGSSVTVKAKVVDKVMTALHISVLQ